MQKTTSDQPRQAANPDELLPVRITEKMSGPDAPPAKKPGWRRWIRPFLLILGPLLILAAAGYIYFSSGRYISTENAYIKADKVMVAAEVSGLITEVAVRENQRIARGDILFRIDDRPYRIALDEAEAQLANVRDELLDLKATYRQKEEELALALTNIAFAKNEFERQSKLAVSGTIPRSKFDATRHDLDVARLRSRIVEQEMAQVRAQLGGAPDTPVTDIPVYDHARYLQTKAARDAAALNLERTIVRAPFAGIAGNTPQVGQQVTGNSPMSSPVMSIVADTNVWIEANFKETELTHVQPGQSVTVQVDTYPDRDWQGTVESISQATGAEFAIIPPQNATGNWVKIVQRIPVRIALDADQPGPPLRAGMSTTIEIDTQYHRTMPAFLQTALSWFGISPTAYAAQKAPPQ